jgi:hypothetical protein
MFAFRNNDFSFCFKYVKPLIFIVFLGLLGFSNNDYRHFFRDLVYSVTPIFLIYIGFWLSANKFFTKRILISLVYISLVFSFIHISQFILDPSLFGKNIDEIRSIVFNPGGNLIIFSLCILLFNKDLGLIRSSFSLFKYLTIFLLFISFFLSYSRTGLVVFIVLTLSLLGIFDKININQIKKVVFISFILFSILYFSFNFYDSGFNEKILNSISEITISDYDNLSDASRNWRGYETFRALTSFQEGSLFFKVFGFGFGALIDLALTIKLGESEYDAIPILHNGYAYILVKTGLLGLLFYFNFFVKIFKGLSLSIFSDSEDVFYSRLCKGILFSLILTMIVVGGMPQIHDCEFLILLGVILFRFK